MGHKAPLLREIARSGHTDHDNWSRECESKLVSKCECPPIPVKKQIQLDADNASGGVNCDSI